MAAPAPSTLDFGQVLQGSFDDANGRLRVETTATVVNGAVEVALDAADDSVAVKDPSTGYALKVNADGSINVSQSTSVQSNVSIIQGGNTAIVNSQGQLQVTGNTTVAGTVTTEQAGLNNFQTSQYVVGTTVQQLTPTPLTGRSSLSLRVSTSNTGAIYVGNSNAVTTTSGYPLYSGDTISMDLTTNGQIWAIADTVTQVIAALEIA